MVWRPCHMNQKKVFFPFVPPLVVLCLGDFHCNYTHLNRALNDRLFSRKYSIFNILVHQDQIIVTDEWWWQEVELFKIRRVIYVLLLFKLVCIFILRLLLISTRCTYWDFGSRWHNLRLLLLITSAKGAYFETIFMCAKCIIWYLYTSGHISSGCLFRGDCREETEWVLRWPHLTGRPPATTCVEVDSLLFLLVAEFFLYFFFPFLHFLLLSSSGRTTSGRQTVSEWQRHSL